MEDGEHETKGEILYETKDILYETKGEMILHETKEENTRPRGKILHETKREDFIRFYTRPKERTRDQVGGRTRVQLYRDAVNESHSVLV
ncbi:hypothetical protein Pmani_030875 [Petrolisthes manimaculis]|uniref:Uncharacterized protein n=1 Tax=Petrolisthes manimaculis TaxID=1843537 RepID=A0AAE1TVG3_9EUCA|nr:hypothetical protein Pmani_030875 [Petrolisthes manimaculis]